MKPPLDYGPLTAVNTDRGNNVHSKEIPQFFLEISVPQFGHQKDDQGMIYVIKMTSFPT